MDNPSQNLLFAEYLESFYSSVMEGKLVQAKYYGELTKDLAYEFYEAEDYRVALGLLNYLSACQELKDKLNYPLEYEKVFGIFEKNLDRGVGVGYMYGCALFNYSVYLLSKGFRMKAEKCLERCISFYRLMVIENPSEINYVSYLQALRDLVWLKKDLNKPYEDYMEEFFDCDEQFHNILLESDLFKISEGLSNANQC